MPTVPRRRYRRLRNAYVALLSVVGLVLSAWGQSDPLCPHIVACEYEAPAFSIRLVDQQTGQPLTDVHAIAAWVFYGGPRRRGLLMVLEAVSGPDGRVSFGAWGPFRSGVEGLLPSYDPVISVFRSEYQTKLIRNATPLGQPHTARVHSFDQPGETFELAPFHGTSTETIAELRRAADPFDGAVLSDHDPASFQRAYVTRLRRVRVAAETLPQQTTDVRQLLWRLDSSIRHFDLGGGR